MRNSGLFGVKIWLKIVNCSGLVFWNLLISVVG